MKLNQNLFALAIFVDLALMTQAILYKLTPKTFHYIYGALNLFNSNQRLDNTICKQHQIHPSVHGQGSGPFDYYTNHGWTDGRSKIRARKSVEFLVARRNSYKHNP